MARHPEDNPTVEVKRDDLLWAVNTLKLCDYDGQITQRLEQIVVENDPKAQR